MPSGAPIVKGGGRGESPDIRPVRGRYTSPHDRLPRYRAVSFHVRVNSATELVPGGLHP